MPVTIRKHNLPSFVALGMEEELIDLINEYGEGQFFDLKELDLRWTFWDDDIMKRTDANGYTHGIEGVSADTAGDTANVIVHWHGCRGMEKIKRLDYTDDDNNNCAEWIFEEVISEFGKN